MHLLLVIGEHQTASLGSSQKSNYRCYKARYFFVRIKTNQYMHVIRNAVYNDGFMISKCNNRTDVLKYLGPDFRS